MKLNKEAQLMGEIQDHLYAIWSADDMDKGEFEWRTQKITQLLNRAIIDAQKWAGIDELEKLSFDVVEPCEPECDDVRHARHEGSWNAHLKIEERLEELRTHTKPRGALK